MSWHVALAIAAQLFALLGFIVALAVDPPRIRRNRRRRPHYRNGALPPPLARCVVSNSPEMDSLR